MQILLLRACSTPKLVFAVQDSKSGRCSARILDGEKIVEHRCLVHGCDSFVDLSVSRTNTSNGFDRDFGWHWGVLTEHEIIRDPFASDLYTGDGETCAFDGMINDWTILSNKVSRK
jgi:hypothetical protein